MAWETYKTDEHNIIHVEGDIGINVAKQRQVYTMFFAKKPTKQMVELAMKELDKIDEEMGECK